MAVCTLVPVAAAAPAFCVFACDRHGGLGIAWPVRPSRHGPRPHPMRFNPFQRDPAHLPPLLHTWVRRQRALGQGRTPDEVVHERHRCEFFSRVGAQAEKAREILPRFRRYSPNSAISPPSSSPDSAMLRPISATILPPQTFGRVRRHSSTVLASFCRNSTLWGV